MVDSCLPLHLRSTIVIMIPFCSIWIITNHSTNFTSKRTKPSCLVVILFWRARSASSSSRWPRRSKTSRSGSIYRRWSTNRLCTMRWVCMSLSVNRLTRCTFSTTLTFTLHLRSFSSSSEVTFRIILRKLFKESTMDTSTPSTILCSGSNWCARTVKTL